MNYSNYDFKDVNRVYFSKEQYKSGELWKFLECLLDRSYGEGSTKCLINIKPEDCGAFIVEFVDVDWKGEYGGEFIYVDESLDYFVGRYISDRSGHYVQDKMPLYSCSVDEERELREKVNKQYDKKQKKQVKDMLFYGEESYITNAINSEQAQTDLKHFCSDVAQELSDTKEDY